MNDHLPFRLADPVATEGDRREVESLPLATKRFGDFVRGRMPPSGMISEAGRQAQCRACRDIEGLFESLLAEALVQ